MEQRFYLLLVIGVWHLDNLVVLSSNAEHKVHNIVLYPDKHSWCKTTEIKQVVSYPGCDSIEVDNNVCVGACFSYSIPRTLPSSPGEVIPYCDSCQPSNTTLKQVTLKCSSGELEGEVLHKTVEIITNCSCATCNLATRNLELDSLDDHAEDTPETIDGLLDVPQLLSLLHSSKKLNETLPSSHHKSVVTPSDKIINERLSLFLTKLNENVDETSDTTQEALRELFHLLEDENHKLDESTFSELIRNLEEEEHINIDTGKLRDLLVKVENAEKEKTDHSHHAHHRHMHGPHHSLVLKPDLHDMIRSGVYLPPTLDVPSHHLKPALAGSELSYQNNLLVNTDTEKKESVSEIDEENEQD